MFFNLGSTFYLSYYFSQLNPKTNKKEECKIQTDNNPPCCIISPKCRYFLPVNLCEINYMIFNGNTMSVAKQMVDKITY